MPQRHSKNAGDKHHFTYEERKELGYGTQKVRYGADSQLVFGNCCLCLQAAKEPMATPSGHIYCRECIIEYLLAKTRDLKRHRYLARTILAQ
jgi:nitric oxide synthase-interacting protein